MNELLMQLFEKGIDIEITSKNMNFMIELTNLSDGTMIGKAEGNTEIDAITTIFKTVIEENKFLRDNSKQFNGLSVL